MILRDRKKGFTWFEITFATPVQDLSIETMAAIWMADEVCVFQLAFYFGPLAFFFFLDGERALRSDG